MSALYIAAGVQLTAIVEEAAEAGSRYPGRTQDHWRLVDG